MTDYTIPDQTRIGHIHLKVADLDRALAFYRGILGFTLITMYGEEAAFVSAGGYHHHIGLNTWYSKDAPPAPTRSAGLFHTAILYPTRRDLAVALQRLIDAKYHNTGASDQEWPHKPDGSIEVYTHPLDLEGLLGELQRTV